MTCSCRYLLQHPPAFIATRPESCIVDSCIRDTHNRPVEHTGFTTSHKPERKRQAHDCAVMSCATADTAQVLQVQCTSHSLLAGELHLPSRSQAVPREPSPHCLAHDRNSLRKGVLINSDLTLGDCIRGCAHSSPRAGIQFAEDRKQELASVQVVGFSGTNDNRSLLPLQVRAQDTEDATIKGTNGRMVHLLLQPGKCSFARLSTVADQDHCLAERVLELVLKENADALIDAGECRAQLWRTMTSCALPVHACCSGSVTLSETARCMRAVHGRTPACMLQGHSWQAWSRWMWQNGC